MRILFVTLRFPYPPVTGDRLRAFQQLRILSERHSLTLVSLADHRLEVDARRRVGAYCERLEIVPFRRREGVKNLLRRAFSDIPLQVALYESAELRARLESLLSTTQYDLLHMQLARATLNLPAGIGIPKLLDLVDALSINMEGRSRHTRGPARWLARLESLRMRRYEKTLCTLWDRVTVVADGDRAAIGSLANLGVNRNGVDLEEFPFVAAGRQPDLLVFTGNLGYFPNVQAVSWLVREVLPLVQHRRPGVRLQLVGARPDRSLRALARESPGVEIIADVARMHPYLANAAVAVAPLWTGSGQSLKVLEAMASGAPLVATPTAVRGIAVSHGRHLLVAAQPQDFAESILTLLADPLLATGLAERARGLVENEYSWRKSVEQLEAIYRTLRIPPGAGPAPC